MAEHAERRQSLVNSGKIQSIGETLGAFVQFIPLTKEGSGTVTFEAKAQNDILLCFNTHDQKCLGQDGRDDSPAYEIVIGGWMNSKTAIRKRGHIQNSLTKSENPEGLITSRDFAKYWATFEHGRLEFGKGEAGQDTILRWKDKTPIDAIKYIGFGSWHTPVILKNVKMMQPILSDDVLAKKYDPGKNNTWYNSERLSDCYLMLSGVDLYAHKAVLFCASPVFAELISQPPVSTKQGKPLYQMPAELRQATCLQLLKFIYTSRVVVDQADAAELFKWASHFALTSLIYLCRLYFSNPQVYGGVELKASRSTQSAAPTQTPAVRSSPAILKKSLTSRQESSDGIGRLRKSGSGNTSGQLSTGGRSLIDFSALFSVREFSDLSLVFLRPNETSPEPIFVKELRAHRVVLAMHSEPFFLMFINPMRESAQRRVELYDDPEVFELFLEYLYTGNVQNLARKSLEGEIVPLLVIADHFAVYSLRQFLGEMVIQRINEENVCELLMLANVYNIHTLRGECIEFIEERFSTVAQTAGFLELDATTLMTIAFDDNLKVDNERTVFDAVMTWGTAYEESDPQPGYPTPALELSGSAEIHPHSRGDQLRELLSYIRYPLIKPKTLTKILSENAIVSSTPYLTTLVKEAIDLQEKPNLVVRRKSERMRELFFANAGDENGVVYWIATQGRVNKFLNPHKTGKVRVTCSSPISRFTRPEVLVGRAYITSNFVGGDAKYPAWWAIDLGPTHKLACNYYSLHLDGSSDCPNDWTLQASNDQTTWTALQVHTNDRPSWMVGSMSAWPVTNVSHTSTYRYFRVIVSGPSAAVPHKFCLCGLELYGYLLDVEDKAAPPK